MLRALHIYIHALLYPHVSWTVSNELEQRRITGSEVVGTGIDEVDESGAAIELGQEHGGIGLGIGRLDPLKARPYRAVVATPFTKNPTTVAAHSPNPSSSLLLLLNLLLLRFLSSRCLWTVGERERLGIPEEKAKVGYLCIQWFGLSINWFKSFAIWLLK